MHLLLFRPDFVAINGVEIVYIWFDTIMIICINKKRHIANHGEKLWAKKASGKL